MNSPMQKAAIVTGASRGIGRAIARRLASKGIAVAVVYASRESDADSLVGEIISAGGTAFAVRAEVSNPAEVAHLFAEAKKRFGKINILVHCAGTFTQGSIADMTVEEFDRVFNVNARGTFLVCKAAAKLLEDGGRVINIASTVTSVMMPGYGVYTASKGAVDQLTRVLAMELAPRKITVNAIAPGPVDTELFTVGKTPEMIGHMAKMTPLGRIGLPDDIADLAAFLASEESGWITGQIIRSNGGLA